MVGPVRKDPTGARPSTCARVWDCTLTSAPSASTRSFRDASPLKVERLEGVDLVVVRELTGGIYFGPRQEATVENPEAFDNTLQRR